MPSPDPSAAKPRDVIDVLAQMPHDEFAALRARIQRTLERARAEVARLEHEEQQLDEAARKKWEEERERRSREICHG